MKPVTLLILLQLSRQLNLSIYQAPFYVHLFPSYILYLILCSRCDMFYIGERLMRATFREHRRVIIGNHSVSDMKIEAIYPISGSNYIAAKDMKCVSFLNLSTHFPILRSCSTVKNNPPFWVAKIFYSTDYYKAVDYYNSSNCSNKSNNRS